MKSFLSTLATIFLITNIVSCGNNAQTDTKTLNTVSDTITQVDSTAIIEKQREMAKTRDSLPKNCTAQQAINYMKTSGYWDKYSSGIIPSIVEQHLPYAQVLINNKFDHFIIVDKGSMHVLLYDKYGNLKLHYKMACGRNYGHKQGKADSRTPEGIFKCGGWYDSTDWLYTNDWGVTSPRRGQFGPRFIRVCPQIGIHGTGARYSIGNRCSHGCIRIQNENVLELVKYVDKGMPIIVNPGPRDKAVNEKNGVKMPMLNIPNIPGDKPKDIIEVQTSTKKKENKVTTTTKTAAKQKDTTKTEQNTTAPTADSSIEPVPPIATPEEPAKKVEAPSSTPTPTTPSAEPKQGPTPAPKQEPAPVVPATTE
ncbi:MAG: L,D-transpeptidase family protein [Muribaculaceae bacterium]|nr:L,D-transpeptidase family protein [Muribaculaceae bacterium]